MLKKIVLALIGLSFAFSVTSCKHDADSCDEKKDDKAATEKHHDRW